MAIVNYGHAVAQTTGLPAPWSAQTIGSPAIAGSVSFDQGQFTVTAAGKDIGGQSDQFHFVYQQVSGDVDVVARVDSVTMADAWSKTGVMIRSSLAANAANGFALVSASKGVAFQRRLLDGGQSTKASGPLLAPPQWARLVRLGTKITAYSSVDGSTWSTIGTSTIALGSVAYVGLATTSHNVATATTAILSQVGVVPLALPAPQQSMDIGAPAIIGSASYRQGAYTVHAGGADVGGTSDQFHFVYQLVSGDMDVVARVSSITNASSLSMTGVMIRETLTAGSRHAFALSSAGSGYAFRRRVDTAGFGQNTAGPTGAPPGWVRLVRTGSVIEAFQSPNGTTWTSIGSDAIPMADSVYVGIATASHKATTATDAVLDNLSITPIGATNQPPQVAMTAPADGTTVTAGTDVALTAAANDADGTISRVDFFAGATPIGSDTTEPYGVTWSGVQAGTYSLTAVAVDNDGAATTSATVGVQVDPAANQPPTVTLTAPANGATYTAPATVSLSVSATDADGTIARVEFYAGTTLLNTDTTAPYAFTWSSVTAGTYAVRAIGYDNAGASGSSATATITVTSVNQTPVATLTAPANGASYTAPATVALSATATDADGTIARVEFYAGTTLLNTDTTAPFAFSWSAVATGTYAVRAVAYDNAGASGSSATATITVATPASNGLLNAYGLNEGTGTTAGDDSGNGASGTLTGATWTAGRYGQAVSFDGSDVVTFGDRDLAGSFTVMGWLQTRTLYAGTCGSFIMKAYDYGFELCGGQLSASVGSGTSWTATVAQPLTTADLNVWKHVALTYDGAALRLYVDSALVNTATGAHGSNNSTLLFGRWTPASEYWDGLIDEVRLYSRNLTQSEIQTDMNTPVGGGTGNLSPTATLTAPANGATYTEPATVSLTASATDADGTIARVEFYNGATLINTDTTAPYAFTWSSVGAGTYAVRAVAYDNGGASGSSATATITVTGTNQAPTAVLTSPANGATYTETATVALSASATDADGTIARVEFYNGATLLNTDTTAPYAFTWSWVGAGTYAVRAVAYDNAGASATSAINTITVSSTTTPPTGGIFHASTDHATLVTSYDLRIFASGADPNTATPIATSGLGKPTPDASGDITFVQTTFFSNLATGSYVAAISAIGSGGTSTSTGVAFTR
jgi:regulation of enolase protein 1 (concanavalin A-like superfamily)